MCSVLDGYSRFIVHWEIREAVKESDVEIILQRAREKFPEARPRIISDNGLQVIVYDFKAFIRVAGMTYVCMSPYYPQSNGKIEPWHRTIKTTTIRPLSPESLEEARSAVRGFVQQYNDIHLHSAIGYVAPADMLNGHQQAIWDERDRRSEAAQERRRKSREEERRAA